MLQRIKKCKFCGREVAIAPLEWAENPLCSNCLEERLQKAADQIGPTEWRRVGHYLVLTPKPEIHSAGDRQPDDG